MRRIMLIIAYKGSNYCGWQKQINGNTIEEIFKIENEEINDYEVTKNDSYYEIETILGGSDYGTNA